jgi:AcrR family transcriptional regulator
MSSARPYRSPLREQQARQTRQRIRAAARALFTEHGFAETTVADIAAKAGVSAATIYATFGSKAGVVTAMVEDMEEAVAADVEPPAQGTDADPRADLRTWIAAHCALFAEGIDILRAALQAIHAPEVAALMAEGGAHRRARVQMLAERLEASGALRSPLTAREAADRMWLLSTVDSYVTAIDRLGWTPDRYREWLGDLVELDVLGARPDA